MVPWGIPRRLAGMMLWLPGVVGCVGGWVPSRTLHPPAPAEWAHLVPPRPAVRAASARRNLALDAPAAPTKSVAAHPPQSPPSANDDGAHCDRHPVPGAS